MPDPLSKEGDPLRIAAGMLQQENEKLRNALAWCLRDRREADKVYAHATSALGPNQASNVLAEEPSPLARRERRRRHREINALLPSVDDLTR